MTSILQSDYKNTVHKLEKEMVRVMISNLVRLTDFKQNFYIFLD